MTVSPHEVRLGGAVTAVGAAPFAAGALVALVGREVAGSPIPCPVRALLGVPCPLCGGTRAFELAATGDPGFLSYNAFWVVLAAAAVVFGLVSLIGARVGHAPATAVVARIRGAPVVLTVAVVLGAWAVALVNRGPIVG